MVSFRIFFVLLFLNLNAFAGTLQVQVSPIGFTETDRQNVLDQIFKSSPLQSELRGKEYRVISNEIHESPYGWAEYEVYIYDYTQNKMLKVHGPLSFNQDPRVETTARDREASHEEFVKAVQLLQEDPNFKNAFSAAGAEAYEPMPSIIQTLEQIPQIGAPRIIAVGLISTSQPELNEIVGVDLKENRIVRFAKKAPINALATSRVCGVPNSGQSNTDKGVLGSALIEIQNEGQPLWKMNVTRPSASSGEKASGLEVTDVYYKGQLILKNAHTPIINVKYIDDKCGPYRDWGYAESAFRADGTDKAPGIRIATVMPKTVFDDGIDKGNFQGVAIFSDAEKVTMVTELAAGWYRYVSKLEFYADGKIKPYFQFSAVQNSCVCYSHNHHVYWRLDFDIGNSTNSAFVSNGQSFKLADKEASFIRTSKKVAWKVLNQAQNNGYLIRSGDHDGIADEYSVGDAWFLKFNPAQIDDSSARNSTQSALNKFLDSENIKNENLVMWYSAHFLHTHTEDGGGADEGANATVGPILTPVTQ